MRTLLSTIPYFVDPTCMFIRYWMISFRARPSLLLMKRFNYECLPISGPPIMFEFQNTFPPGSFRYFFHLGLLTSRPPEGLPISGPPIIFKFQERCPACSLLYFSLGLPDIQASRTLRNVSLLWASRSPGLPSCLSSKSVVQHVHSRISFTWAS